MNTGIIFLLLNIKTLFYIKPKKQKIYNYITLQCSLGSHGDHSTKFSSNNKCCDNGQWSLTTLYFKPCSFRICKICLKLASNFLHACFKFASIFFWICFKLVFFLTFFKTFAAFASRTNYTFQFISNLLQKQPNSIIILVALLSKKHFKLSTTISKLFN